MRAPLSICTGLVHLPYHLNVFGCVDWPEDHRLAFVHATHGFPMPSDDLHFVFAVSFADGDGTADGTVSSTFVLFNNCVMHGTSLNEFE
jgi:hypothetical protein